MKRSDNNGSVGWWEYPVYLMVTFGLLIIALVLLPLIFMGKFFAGKMWVRGLAAAAVVIACSVLYISYQYQREVDLQGEEVSLIIAGGDSFGKITHALVERGVVSSKLMLKWSARWRGIDRKLTPGKYTFSGRNSCRSVLDRLERADVVKVKVTIPEGTPIWQVASILSARMGIDSARLIDLNHDPEFLAELDLPYLEGYLFPETYYFAWGTDLEAIVAEMSSLFALKVESAWTKSTPLGLSRAEIIRLASVVEAEARLDNERARIASVYLNRLRRKMKLDADPTVIYGLGGLDRPLYHRDLRKDTPYNTYIHKGLPPTPINSPGLASIIASLNPESTDYLFFVADDSGGHIFSRTNAEHNRARQRIKANR